MPDAPQNLGWNAIHIVPCEIEYRWLADNNGDKSLLCQIHLMTTIVTLLAHRQEQEYLEKYERVIEKGIIYVPSVE